MNGKKRNTYINVAIMTLIIGGIFYSMDQYLFYYVRNLSNEVVEAKKNVELINERNKKIDEVRHNYNNIEKEIGVISNTFVKKDYEKVGEMFMEMENIADRYQIELEKDPASKGEEKMGDSISAAYFNIAAKGEYENLMKFMVHLDNFKYYIDLNNVEIASAGDGINLDNAVMRSELEVYLNGK